MEPLLSKRTRRSRGETRPEALGLLEQIPKTTREVMLYGVVAPGVGPLTVVTAEREADSHWTGRRVADQAGQLSR